MKNYRKIFGTFLGITLFSGAVWVIQKELATWRPEAIYASWQQLPALNIVFAAILTMASYTVLTGYDTLALYVTGKRLAYRDIAQASFMGYAFSNNIGLSMVAGASVRYRIYSDLGLSAADIARVFALCVITAWLGFFTLAGLIFTCRPMPLEGTSISFFPDTRGIGIALICAVAFILVLSASRGKRLRILGREFTLPGPGLISKQLALSITDWSIASGVLYVLIPKDADIGFMTFTGIFLLAQVAGFSSQVPGGLGVFDAVMLVLLSSSVPAKQVIVALLAYRAIYYIAPLVLAAILMGMREIRVAKNRSGGTGIIPGPPAKR